MPRSSVAGHAVRLRHHNGGPVRQDVLLALCELSLELVSDSSDAEAEAATDAAAGGGGEGGGEGGQCGGKGG